MFLVLFFILVIMWVMGFVAFHIARGMIHLLLLVALISLLMHLFRGRRT
jgi:hypothetical protein